jgi:uncharacterized membrane protein
MIWDKHTLAALPVKSGFRHRGESMSRLEVFSDAAFAFALTMLVVSVGIVPSNYPELVLALKTAPAFALSFAQISVFWIYHRAWSRQFGLEDGYSTFLTLLMIFIILLYVYPLRLMFSTFAAFASGGWLPSEFAVTSIHEVTQLFVIYGIGFGALTLVIALLYRHALKNSHALLLNKHETLLTQRSLSIWLTQSVFGMLSAAFAGLMPATIGVYAGFVYFGLGITIPWISIHYERKIRSLKEDN